MKAEIFVQMPLDKKLNQLWDNGECVHQNSTVKGHTLCIFSLGDFFVEAIYAKNNNQVLSIRFMDEFVAWKSYVDRTTNLLINLN